MPLYDAPMVGEVGLEPTKMTVYQTVALNQLRHSPSNRGARFHLHGTHPIQFKHLQLTEYHCGICKWSIGWDLNPQFFCHIGSVVR